MPRKRLEIEDVSDCDSCTERADGTLPMLASVKCKLLTGLTCPDCGRAFALFVEDDAKEFQL